GWFGPAGSVAGIQLPRRDAGVVVFGRSEECFGAVVVVDSGLAVIQVGWWCPFAFAAGVDGGLPAAVIDGAVVGSAGQGHLVDVGVAAVSPVLVGVVGLAAVGAHGATRFGAAAVAGDQHDPLRG